MQCSSLLLLLLVRIPFRSRSSRSSDFWGGLDRQGHRGVWSEFGEANLFTRIAMRAPFVHDFSVATAETGSVWADSWGTDLNLDFHKVGVACDTSCDKDFRASCWLSGACH
jgi:hypothetical protein